MRTTKCFPWCLLLAWVWPLQAQQTTVKDTVVANDALEAQSNLTIVHLDLGTRLTPFDEMIIGKEKEVLDLTAKGDYANWANLLSDDAVAVYDTGYASKAEVLKALKGMSDFHCSMDKVRVMPIGKTAALIIYRMTQGWKEQGKPMTSQYYISSLWVKRGGKWLSQFWQETDTTNSQGAEEKTVRNQNNSATDTKELLQIETDLLNAYVHRDLSVRDRYVADEFVGVDGSGNVYSKQQDMQELKEGTFAMKSFLTEGVQVRIFGDSAIVTGRNTETSVYKGKEQADTIQYVDTFLKRNGRWQLVYSQDTNVANTAIPEANATELPPDSFFIAKEKEDWEALKHKDKAAAARLLADDFVGMYDFGFFNKSEWVKQMDDQYTVDDYTIEGPKVLHPSPTTALLLYTFHM